MNFVTALLLHSLSHFVKPELIHCHLKNIYISSYEDVFPSFM